MTDARIEIRSARAKDVIPLRHAVLRAHQRLDEAQYPGDDDPRSLHLVAGDGDTIVGVISVFPEPLPPELATALDVSASTPSWRIRGMAVAPDRQDEGIGRRMLVEALEELEDEPERWTWCNARTTTSGFYEALGFRVVGEAFDIEGIGEHLRLVLPTPSAG